MIQLNPLTPVEVYQVKGRTVYVKREDQCCPAPGPPFSKVRGLWEKMSSLKANGISVVGYTETSISMAGVGVAWVAQQLGMRAVIFDPQYNQPNELLLKHRAKWKEFGAELVPIEAGRAKINYYSSKKMLKDRYKNGSEMLELGLPLSETVEATADQWVKTVTQLIRPATTVVPVGSGTVCAGLLRGWKPGDGIIIGVMGRTGDLEHKKESIEARGYPMGGGLGGSPLVLEDPGWEYTQASTVECPFPCHRYYDLKAWEWLRCRIKGLKDPVLFWNVGREI